MTQSDMNQSEFQAAYQAPAQPEEQPQPQRPDPARGRRVGTVTMGVALICFGGLMIAGMLFPQIEYFHILQFSPIILVALGVEILVQYFMRRGQALKYDFLSGFVCIVLIGASLLMSMVPLGIRYFGPQRYNREQELRSELYNIYYEELSPLNSVTSLRINFTLRYTESPDKITVNDLTAADGLSLTCGLDGEYEDAKAFTDAVYPVLRRILDLEYPVSNISFYSHGEKRSFELDLGNRFSMNLSPEKLEKRVEVDEYWEEEDLQEDTEEGQDGGLDLELDETVPDGGEPEGEKPGEEGESAAVPEGGEGASQESSQPPESLPQPETV